MSADATEFLQKLQNCDIRLAAVLPSDAHRSERFRQFNAEARRGRQFRTFEARAEAEAWL